MQQQQQQQQHATTCKIVLSILTPFFLMRNYQIQYLESFKARLIASIANT